MVQTFTFQLESLIPQFKATYPPFQNNIAILALSANQILE
jgi:hypothetical protein